MGRKESEMVARCPEGPVKAASWRFLTNSLPLQNCSYSLPSKTARELDGAKVCFSLRCLCTLFFGLSESLKGPFAPDPGYLLSSLTLLPTVPSKRGGSFPQAP